MRIFCCLPLLLCILLAGCVKNEMRITFSLPEDTDGSCRVVYYASAENVGMYRETAAVITAGKGELTLPMRHPTLVYLFSPSGRTPGAIIYARRGDRFEIRGNGINVAEWRITGNEATDSLSAWRLRNASALAEADTEAINRAAAAFVERNPGQKAAAIILYQYFVRRGHEQEFLDLETKIDRKVLDDADLMRALTAADLMTSTPTPSSLPERIILPGDSGVPDTLLLGKGKAAMLLFLAPKGSEPIEPDSLRSLTKDAKGHLLAELYAEPDSLMWRRHIRRDSIGAMRRFWLPLGLGDSLAISMGVRRMPYFVVIGPSGKELYRGDDWKQASETFKKLSP